MEEYTLWLRLMHRLRESCSNFDNLWIKRRRVFNTEAMVKGLLHLVGGSNQSYHRVMGQIDNGPAFSPTASSFCEARAKLPYFVIGEIRRDILNIWDENSSGKLWHGYRTYAIDGTKVSLPRPLFEHGFKAPGGGYCPQGLVSLMLRLDDRMVCDIRLSKQENERHEAHEHLSHLSKNDLVIYDRGYMSFALLNAHIHGRIAALFRIAKSMYSPPLQEFWKSSELEEVVTINPKSTVYYKIKRQYPEYELKPIQLRLIKYWIDGNAYVLATTILDSTITREEFIELYTQRWRVEETFKSYKQTLEFETFHSKSENGVMQEIEAVALLWNITRALSSIADSAIKKNYPAAQFHRITRSIFSKVS